MNGDLILFKPETVKVGNSCVNGILGQLETAAHLERILTECKSLIHYYYASPSPIARNFICFTSL